MGGAVAAPAHKQDHRKAALLLIGGVLLFASLDAVVKYLTARHPAPTVVFARYLSHALLMAVLVLPREGRALLAAHRPHLVALRALCLAAMSLLAAIALKRMPVAETTAIGFLAPTLVMLGSVFLLDEKIGPGAWIAALLGLAGVALIARPGSGLALIGVLAALGMVGTNAAYQLLSRGLANSERTVVMLFYTALIGTGIFGAVFPLFGLGTPPSGREWALLGLTGALGGGGHYLFTAAFRHAPASTLAPLTYIQLVWAGLIGWLVFGHVPGAVSLLGMALVAAAGVLSALDGRRAQAAVQP
jgi:drug/metabolite transporter (DMT)-like permease